MNNISRTQEDYYIAYLAGKSDGKKIIESNANWKQKHHFVYKIQATLIGTIKSFGLVTISVLAYPLLNSEMRNSIFGSKTDVCSACADSSQYLLDLRDKIKWAAEEKTPLYIERIGYAFNSYMTGYQYGSICSSNDVALMECRKVNYVWNVFDTLSHNYSLIVGVALLAAWFAASKMNSLNEQAHTKEKKLKADLTEKYKKIADRLSDLKENQKIQNYAKKILQRKSVINKEIKNLHLPNLTGNDIKVITQPVFTAAKQLQRSDLPEQ